MRTLTVGHSPDADDAFMFYAFAKERVKIEDCRIDHVMEDIESLNRRAMQGELDVTAISAAVYPRVAKHYRIMACGASVGRNYGPVLLARKQTSLKSLSGMRIGIPGSHTTAYLLLKLFTNESFQPVMLPFSSVMSAVEHGEVAAGVIIHEGQLTWEKLGFRCILDLGKAWTKQTGLPIPLGLDVVSRRFDDVLQRRITESLGESIRYARAHEDEAIDYALQFGRGIDRETCRAFVRMYVNEDTVNMGDEGRKALETLYERAAERSVIPEPPVLDIIGLS